MKSPRSLALFGLTLIATAATAQQKVQWDSKFNIPVAPTGLAHRPLPDHPVVFDTGEGQNIRVVVVTKALEYPWSAAFLPDGSMLVTERAGRLRIIRKGVLDPKPIAGGPASFWAGESGGPGAVHGYMDVALHPRFAENHFIYLAYTKPLDGGKRTTAIARGRWDNGALADVKDIFTLDEASTSRIAFGSDGMLYMTTTGKDPQDPNTLGGKVLRLRDDGSVPPDNPFVGQAGHRAEVYTMGHRSALGLAVNPATGEMWQNENGPNGGDEINILKPGRNYGWPIVSYGRTYQGPWQVAPPGHAGFEPPVVIWIPAIAVSGMTFYTGDKFPKWKGDAFVGSLRTGEIPGTGHLERILFNDKMEELRREALLRELRQRIRDVRQGPDGFLYVLTDEKEGAVLRIEPAQ
ncbi:MAG TPA: PQQ-dependent sugar dehydrogenase [Bryobacteraceae bacterium]|jgi:glucose/arabinose dehydrogenase|nr:PQQ-dependent sugar dehydrogenase [Bryobacteraceae bacterium]